MTTDIPISHTHLYKLISSYISINHLTSPIPQPLQTGLIYDIIYKAKINNTCIIK